MCTMPVLWAFDAQRTLSDTLSLLCLIPKALWATKGLLTYVHWCIERLGFTMSSAHSTGGCHMRTRMVMKDDDGHFCLRCWCLCQALRGVSLSWSTTKCNQVSKSSLRVFWNLRQSIFPYQIPSSVLFIWGRCCTTHLAPSQCVCKTGVATPTTLNGDTVKCLCPRVQNAT